MFRMLLLTAQRRDEVGEMRWSEVDLEARTWTLPRHRSKNDKAHTVHLSDTAMAILTGLAAQRRKFAHRKASDLVFVTPDSVAASGFSWAKAKLDREMLKARRRGLRQPEDDGGLRKVLGITADRPLPAEIAHWTLHDLRRTAAIGMARLKIAPHVVDRILNHTSGTIRGVAKIYNRHGYEDDRRDALAAWSRVVMSLVRPAADKVVQLRAGT